MLTTGMISLVLAASSTAALAGAADPEDKAPRPLNAALSEDGSAETADGASEGDANAEGGMSLHPTAAEIEAIIRRELSAADLEALVSEAAAGAVLEDGAPVSALAAELDLRDEALVRILEMLGRQDVPPERLAEMLATIVARHKSLLARVRLLEASDPRVARLRDALAAAIETGEYERVDALLAEAKALELEAMWQLLEALDPSVLDAAAADPEAGLFAGTRHGYGVARQRSLFHGARRLGFGAFLWPFSSGRFCDWHPGHRICERLAESPRVCARRPNHPLCDDDRFCKKRQDHPLCNDDPPPSRS